MQEKQIKMEDAVNFAEMLSYGKPNLKKKLYQRALQEFRDDEFLEERNRAIEGYLNKDISTVANK